MADVNDLFNVFSQLKFEDRLFVIEVLSNNSSNLSQCNDLADFLTEKRFSNGKVCPICGCVNIVCNGHQKDGKQRYKCKDCGKTFVITSNSIVSGTRKSLVTWGMFVQCTINQYSLRKTAKRCGIHKNTAFIWRHKLLDALQDVLSLTVLEGIIEADETFFSVSYKGNHKNSTFVMPRKPHRRGSSIHTRGLSHEKVCVPCAISRNGYAVSTISNLGRISIRNLHNAFDNKLQSNSILCTDKLASYIQFSRDNNLNLIQLRSGKSIQGIYHIQHINRYHGDLKDFIRSFKGVSTKYLNNYLTLFSFMYQCSQMDENMTSKLLTTTLRLGKKISSNQLSSRPAIPLP